MKFLSIKEFFYKLNTIGFILLLLPLMVFTFLYYRPGYSLPVITSPAYTNWLLSGALMVLLIILTTVQWLKNARIQKLKSLIELSRKMDGYAGIFLFRMITYACFSLLLAVGYFLTTSLLFTAIFILVVIVTFIQWPSRSSFSRLFELNPNEREMIMRSGDMIKIKSKRAR